MNAKRIGDVQTVENTQKHQLANDKYSFIRVQLETGEEVPLLLTDRELKIAAKRAQKNPEDLPRVSKLRNIFD